MVHGMEKSFEVMASMGWREICTEMPLETVGGRVLELRQKVWAGDGD